MKIEGAPFLSFVPVSFEARMILTLFRFNGDLARFARFFEQLGNDLGRLTTTINSRKRRRMSSIVSPKKSVKRKLPRSIVMNRIRFDYVAYRANVKITRANGGFARKKSISNQADCEQLESSSGSVSCATFPSFRCNPLKVTISLRRSVYGIIVRSIKIHLEKATNRGQKLYS